MKKIARGFPSRAILDIPIQPVLCNGGTQVLNDFRWGIIAPDAQESLEFYPPTPLWKASPH